MESQQVGINPLLAAPPTGTACFRPMLLDWDIRRAPRYAARVGGQVASAYYLSQPATHPSVTSLRVVSGLLLENWVIAAHNPAGVTVGDVLYAIHGGLQAPLTQAEWRRMSPAKCGRVEATFYARCEASRDFERARNGGVRCIDCLLHTTLFGGLSSAMLRNNQWEVVLTLSRDFGARARAPSH